jgi:hypothetical protein
VLIISTLIQIPPRMIHEESRLHDLPVKLSK